MKIREVVSTIGPSRRAEVTVVEMVLLTEAEEASQLDAIAAQIQQQMPAKLHSLGLDVEPARWSELSSRATAIAQISGFVCETALILQNAAGHRLEFQDFLQDQDPHSAEHFYHFIFQHDDTPTGEQAGDLALHIASELCPELHWKAALHDTQQPLSNCVAEFIHAAKALVTPAETLGLIAAARSRKIPVLRLEREPYGPLPATFRIAPNGMIMLGHARYRVLMDGLHCIDKPGPGFGSMSDRRTMWQLLAKLAIPTAIDDVALLTAATFSRAKRVARRLTYPVNIRPLQRHPEFSQGLKIASEAQLEDYFSAPSAGNREVIIEPELTGAKLELIFAGGQMLLARLDGQTTEIHPHIKMMAQEIEKALNAGFLLIRMQTRASAANVSPTFLVTDIDPSPPLETLLEDDQSLLDKAYGQFLDWLYPTGSSCRIPIASVTGTNGKTTTCTMISRIARAESQFVGMARTTGVYFDQEMREYGDLSGFYGHCMVFEHEQVELAVLETARGDVLRSGFAFDYSDVAVCSNVTADHIGEHGVYTLEQMAVVKRSILERSAGAVVLNGDDPLCMDMLPFLTGRTIYLSTMHLKAEELREKSPPDTIVINLEIHDGEEWIVLHEAETSHAVIAAKAIPATFNGIARHNISNAMHAIGATRALGYSFESMRLALERFEMSFDSLPGRLNVHDNGRFHIIMDYAHNADGINQLIRFTSQYPCKGRKILRFGVSPNASKAAAHGAAATAAGHFDHYICSGAPGKQAGKIDVVEELKQGLIHCGVSEKNVEIFSDPTRSVEYPASLCQPGDLLVLVTSSATLATTWEKILQT